MQRLSLNFNSVGDDNNNNKKRDLRMNMQVSFVVVYLFCSISPVAERRGAYMPLFNGDSYLELKGLHLYGQDLRYVSV